MSEKAIEMYSYGLGHVCQLKKTNAPQREQVKNKFGLLHLRNQETYAFFYRAFLTLIGVKGNLLKLLFNSLLYESAHAELERHDKK